MIEAGPGLLAGTADGDFINSEQFPVGRQLAKVTGGTKQVRQARTQTDMTCCLTANWTSSALDLIPSSAIMLYLWKATVRALMSRMRAISFIECPSASSW